MKPAHLILATVVTIVSLGGTMWGMVRVHGAAPHADAVHRNEIALLREIIQSEHAGLRREIESLRVELRNKGNK